MKEVWETSYMAGLLMSVMVGAQVLCIFAAKREVGKWNVKATFWFIISGAGFGQRRVEMWMERGYTAREANTIMKYQMLALLGAPLGFLISVVSGIYLFEVLKILH